MKYRAHIFSRCFLYPNVSVGTSWMAFFLRISYGGISTAQRCWVLYKCGRSDWDKCYILGSNHPETHRRGTSQHKNWGGAMIIPVSLTCWWCHLCGCFECFSFCIVSYRFVIVSIFEIILIHLIQHFSVLCIFTGCLYNSHLFLNWTEIREPSLDLSTSCIVDGHLQLLMHSWNIELKR